jgi:hypothetical protein
MRIQHSYEEFGGHRNGQVQPKSMDTAVNTAYYETLFLSGKSSLATAYDRHERAIYNVRKSHFTC